MQILKLVELIAAGSSTLNKILSNQNQRSFWAWVWQMISCIASGYLAYRKGMLVWTTLEIWGFCLSFVLFLFRYKTVSKRTETNTQYISVLVTLCVSTFLFVSYKELGIKQIAELISAMSFMVGLVFMIKNNRYGHLLFGLGNFLLGIIFLFSGMKVFFIQQMFSCFIVVCTFLGHKIDFRKLKILKQKETPD